MLPALGDPSEVIGTTGTGRQGGVTFLDVLLSPAVFFFSFVVALAVFFCRRDLGLATADAAPPAPSSSGARDRTA